jgi:putative DNA methylase
MMLHHRRLPHDYETEHAIFLTWRLANSLPPNRSFPTIALSSGRAFAAMDRLLDEACVGTFHLRQPAIADMIVEAIQYNGDILGQFALHAYVVMPNHVHLLATPRVPLPKLTKSLKGITAKRANQILALTGNRFWQEESYDHTVRHEREFEKIRNYIEENPVRAGLVMEASEYRWSSAWGGADPLVRAGPPGPASRRPNELTAQDGATGGSPADQGVRPTIGGEHLTESALLTSALARSIF